MTKKEIGFTGIYLLVNAYLLGNFVTDGKLGLEGGKSFIIDTLGNAALVWGYVAWTSATQWWTRSKTTRHHAQK